MRDNEQEMIKRLKSIDNWMTFFGITLILTIVGTGLAVAMIITK